MIEDFASDNVKYLEIRTTPRPLKDGTTRREYILGLLSELEFHKKTRNDIIVKLLFSIDRGGEVVDASEMIEIVKQLKKEGCTDIVGIDFSGNPIKGSLMF